MSNDPTSNSGLQQTTSTTYTSYGGAVPPTAYPLPNVYPVGGTFPVNPPFLSSSTTVLPPPPVSFQGGYSVNSDIKPNLYSDLLQNIPKSSNEPPNIPVHKEDAKQTNQDKGTLSKDKCCNMNDAPHHHHHHRHHHPHHNHHHNDNYRYEESGCKPKKQVEHYWFC